MGNGTQTRTSSPGLCFKSNGKTIKITVGVIVSVLGVIAAAVAAWTEIRNDTQSNTACMKKIESKVEGMDRQILSNTNSIERSKDELANIKARLQEIKLSQREQRQEYREDMKELKTLLRR